MEEITKYMLKIDPEFKNLIPPLLPEERAGLEKSLLEEGCRDGIVVWNETIIDGHNRYEICNKHFIDFNIVDMDFDNRNDVKIWIINNQFSRRNLPAYERAKLALVLEPLISAKAKEKETMRKTTFLKSEKSNLPTVDTTKEVAKIAGVGKDTVSKVKKIEEKAPPEVKEKLASGEMSINEAYQDIRKSEKAEQLQQSKKEIEDAAKSVVTELAIHHGDCVEWLENLTVEADLLITDPPYSTDVSNIVEFAQSWLPHALKKVKSTGRAFVCIGAYPEELRAYLNVDSGHLELCQVLVWTYRNTLGPSPKDIYKQNWQAILYYKGADAPDLNCPIMVEQFSVQDINAPDNRHGHYERWHAWQKPDELAERLIRHSTNAGDLVIDPFAGTGTFLIAATKLGREAFGCDNNLDMIKISQSRAGVLA